MKENILGKLKGELPGQLELYEFGVSENYSESGFQKRDLLLIIKRERRHCLEMRTRLNSTHVKEHEQVEIMVEKLRAGLLSLTMTTILGVGGTGFSPKSVPEDIILLLMK